MKRFEGEAERLAHQRHHELRDAVAIAGLLVAATAGAMLGPAWFVIGGVLGVAFGLFGGLLLEREDRRASARDRELDEEIGVTRGDLGAADIAYESMMRLESAQRAS